MVNPIRFFDDVGEIDAEVRIDANKIVMRPKCVAFRIWRFEIERGQDCSLLSFIALADLYGASLDDLIGREPRTDRMRDAIERARVIFDVVAFPSETPLVRRARAFGKALVTGAEVIALQAAKQFELYTGVQPTKEQVLRASVFSRSCP